MLFSAKQSINCYVECLLFYNIIPILKFCFHFTQAISPGIVETEFRQRMYPDEDPEKANKLYRTMEEVILALLILDLA